MSEKEVTSSRSWSIDDDDDDYKGDLEEEHNEELTDENAIDEIKKRITSEPPYIATILNLPDTMSPDDIKNHFNNCNIQDIRSQKVERDNVLKVTCILETKDDLANLLMFNKQDIDGRKLMIDFKSKQNAENRGRNGDRNHDRRYNDRNRGDGRKYGRGDGRRRGNGRRYENRDEEHNGEGRRYGRNDGRRGNGRRYNRDDEHHEERQHRSYDLSVVAENANEPDSYQRNESIFGSGKPREETLKERTKEVSPSTPTEVSTPEKNYNNYSDRPRRNNNNNRYRNNNNRRTYNNNSKYNNNNNNKDTEPKISTQNRFSGFDDDDDEDDE